MKTDWELLELAAKAAGIKYVAMDNWPHSDGCRFWKHGDFCDCGAAWDPLTYNGDAMRLAVTLDMSVDVDLYETSSYAYAGPSPRVMAMEIWQGEKEAATRRAIVRAAAAIGELMP